jgi:DNA-binding MarR family transcriptional regulator
MSDKKEDHHWLGKFVPYLIYRITGHLNRRLRKELGRSGINIARWRVLAVLEDHGRINISRIAKHTLMEQPTVTRVVDQLEREGLAARETAGGDFRVVEVALTRAGKAAFKKIYPIALRHQQLALEGFKPHEIKDLIAYLERIQNNIVSGHTADQD